MTDSELHELILSDPTALALAKAGQDEACRDRCVEIADPDVVPTLLGELGIMAIYTDPISAETVLQIIEAVAQGNAVVARVLKWIQPTAPGVDFGDARVRGMLMLPILEGGLGLSEEQAGPLLRVAERPASILTEDVSRVLLPHRPEGKAGASRWVEEPS